MKKLLLATVATIALTAGGAMAAESSAHGGGMKAGSEIRGNTKVETTGSDAATEVKPGAKANHNAGKGRNETTGAASKDEMKSGAENRSRAEHKSNASNKTRSESTSTKNRSETTGAGSSDEMKAGAEHRSNRKSSAGTKNRNETTGAGANSEMKSSEGSKNGSTSVKEHSGQAGSESNNGSHAAAGGSVSLTADQKTRIRTTVIEARSAPRIERSKINFSLNVGTTVPRSIHVVAVPQTLVEIHPAWRGYRYFVVGDELVIIEPGTLRIVAIVEV